jgi:redox-sensitive bicupin YhaK (pirin superfamily)
MLDLARPRQIGGAHPHAGLETVTLVLEGVLHDRDEGRLTAGDVLWMTAGRGIIHNELRISAGAQGARLVLYAGQPIGEPLVQQGPFVAGSQAEIVEQHRRFRSGQFTSMSALARQQNLSS